MLDDMVEFETASTFVPPPPKRAGAIEWCVSRAGKPCRELSIFGATVRGSSVSKLVHNEEERFAKSDHKSKAKGWSKGKQSGTASFKSTGKVKQQTERPNADVNCEDKERESGFKELAKGRGGQDK